MHRGFASQAVLAGPERLLKRFALAATVAALLLTASGSPAGAAVTLGQVDPDPTPDETCLPDADVTQATGTDGPSYVVPGTGTITSWSHRARDAGGQMFTFKVFRQVADPATYMAVSHDGPHPLLTGTLNTFSANIPVKPGDVIGLNTANGAFTACAFNAPGDYRYTYPGLADGESRAFNGSPGRTNVSAVFVPSNSFTLGATTRNKKKGTATLTVNVLNPGQLTGSGKGVKVANAAVISRTVGGPGAVTLTIKAKGKQKRKLNETGKVKVKPKVTYTPTGGDPSTQSTKVKLKKKL